MGTGAARVLTAIVAVRVLTWLALSDIVWCMRACDSDYLFSRRGFRLK
jgi:hypothetical protein